MIVGRMALTLVLDVGIWQKTRRTFREPQAMIVKEGARIMSLLDGTSKVRSRSGQISRPGEGQSVTPRMLKLRSSQSRLCLGRAECLLDKIHHPNDHLHHPPADAALPLLDVCVGASGAVR